MKRRVTIRDIAMQVGLSPAPVSAALSERRASTSISAATRQLVRRAAKSMGYDRSHLRRRSALPAVVALLCPGAHSPNAPMLYNLLLSIGELLSRQGTRVLLQTADDDKAAEDIAQRWLEHKVDGAIVVGGILSTAALGEAGLPLVHIGELPDGAVGCRVHSDNRLGGRLAGEHLWSLGHRSVGVVQIDFGTSAALRTAGLSELWAERGGVLGPERVLTLDSPPEPSTTERLPAFLAAARQDGAPLTALFCNADWAATSVIRVLRRQGLRVPEDISVVGFDDAHYAELSDPPLTTVRQPFVEIGALAVQLLHEQCSAGGPVDKSYVLPCQLVARGSSAAPPATSNGRGVVYAAK